PGRTVMMSALPAAMSPMTGSVTGESSDASTRSSAWTAYPSIAALSNGGNDTGETTSRAIRQPRASISCRSSGCSGRTVARMSVRCSSTDFTGAPFLHRERGETDAATTACTAGGGRAARRLPPTLVGRGHVLAEPLRERRADVVTFTRQPDGRGEILELGAGVVPTTADHHTVDRAPCLRATGRESAQRVGELDLAAPPRWGVAQDVEHGRVENVPADDGQPARRGLLRRLLHQVGDPDDVIRIG